MRARVRADFESATSGRALGAACDFLGTIRLYGRRARALGIYAVESTATGDDRAPHMRMFPRLAVETVTATDLWTPERLRTAA